MKNAVIKSLSDLMTAGNAASSDTPWRLRAVIHEDCLSYIAWNETSREALIVDPKVECDEAIRGLIRDLGDCLCLAVIDTHTHADHVSSAWSLAKTLACPLVMHEKCGTSRAHLRVSRTSSLMAHAGPVHLIMTPGHTPDGLTVVWGPFAFTGDTVLFNDTGRDDLPGGNPEDHFASLRLLDSCLAPDTIVLPGHDCKGGRAATWQAQRASNPSLSQAKGDFVREASAFDAPAPRDFKRSLFENLK